MTFIPCQMIALLQHHIQSSIDQDSLPLDIRLCWEHFKIPEEDITIHNRNSGQENHQIAFAVQDANHWFAVVFDYTTGNTYVYNQLFLKDNRILQDTDDWKVWNGPKLWSIVAELMDWEVPTRRSPQVKSLCWFGNGYDCGPEAVQILMELLFHNGLMLQGHQLWPKTPTFGCNHIIRETMFYTIISSMEEAYNIWLYNHHRNIPKVEWFNNDIVMDDIRQVFQIGIMNLDCVQTMLHKLPGLHLDCNKCKGVIHQYGDEIMRNAPGSINSFDFGGMEQADEESNGTNDKASNVPLHSLSQVQGKTLTANFKSITIHQDNQEDGSSLSKAQEQIRNSNLWNIVQWQHHINAPEIDKSKIIWKTLKIDPDFDDYNTGPTIQENLGVPLYIKNIPIFNWTQLEPLSIWSLWKDYGYRIDNNFTQTFTSKKPYLVEEHYLPIAPNLGEESLERLRRWDLTRNQYVRVAFTDICFLGMEEMINLAGERKAETNFDLFIRGMCYDPENHDKEELIHLDITKDAKSLADFEVYISMDIDSLIWNTHYLYLKAPLEINMVPYMQNKPPIEFHNHTYVKILKPQTDIQRANNEYTTYELFKTSSIPHIHFGYSGRVNVWIAFPHMIHRQQDSPYWATQIPHHIQNQWFS
ncbi:hypothetical protein M422DRAFT_267132 [Sphaerobolus stellatus SS14]|uniref:Ubiquitin-like protease family profile domain-containing protein n=1 Tax=Sphaerobolus stellatus (strain SS14) TaxID=990650 RepID=A0A0C9UQ52_SPHS4|nr:hypothetical protein M422DRAFT_267132 [Sphaerobolus stellatus SS14]